MSDYTKNPEVPFEIWVPNKIRKRITMHEKADSKVWKLIRATLAPSPLRALVSSASPDQKARGSMWSRFTSRVANILQIKPSGVRE